MSSHFVNAKVVGSGVPSSEYHGQPHKRGSREFVMSRSELVNFSENPSRWIHGYRSESTDSTEWGDLIDCLVTDRGRFKERYAVKPETYTNEKGEVKPWSGNANVCKAWLEERKHMTPIKSEELGDAERAILRLKKDPIIAEFLSCSAKQVMVTAEYHDLATKLVIPVKILVDLVPDASHKLYGQSLGDFKTARDASPRKWQSVVGQYGYHVQGAMYLDVFMAARPEQDRLEFRHIISESASPYEPARRWMDMELITEGRKVYREALANYCQCLSTNIWPSWDDSDGQMMAGWGQVSLAPWMVKQSGALPKLAPQPATTEEERIDIIP